MATTDRLNDALATTAEWLRKADSLLVTAQAGMGVDSGLPDFRGADCFWCAYPALHAEGVHFEVSPTRQPSATIPCRHGASTAIVSICIGARCRIAVSRSFADGGSGCSDA